MYEGGKGWLLRFLDVPPEPDDPLGAGESLLVFRAAPNYFKYRLILWALSQVGFLPFTLVSVAGLTFFALSRTDGIERSALLFAALLVAVLALASLLISYVVQRLDYELRWYKVTDKSLRIREGVLEVREMTMTFANIQNISISQGPIQRLLGIADLEVQSAGGGGGSKREKGRKRPGLDMHTGYFRGVANAVEIRELMLQRLRAVRDTGLGDPDQAADELAPPAASPGLAGVLTALRAEAAAFRAAAERVAARLDTSRW